MTQPIPLDELLSAQSGATLPKPGDTVTGKVVNIIRNKILVDIGGIAVGIIAGRETRDALGTAKELQPGGEVTAVVLEEEKGKEGYFILSLRKAGYGKAWERFQKWLEDGTPVEGKAIDANKGGLLLEVHGIKGFLPVSQLAPLHYPRVDDTGSGEILTRLKSYIGQKFKVKIINVDHEQGKLIFSEKSVSNEQRQKTLTSLHLGQKIKGRISGIVKFGLFVTFEGLEGLVHISEITWGHVSSPHNFGKVGDEVEAVVIGFQGEKISLSIKQLTQDPWMEAVKKYNLGDIAEGTVNSMNNYGIFVTLEKDLSGLVHTSELPEGVKDPKEIAKVGEPIRVKIISLDPKEHRLGFSLRMDRKVEKPDRSQDSGDRSQEEK